ncbi:hypothetical protein, partial [Candidatus Hakubella thermalkaliphila]
ESPMRRGAPRRMKIVSQYAILLSATGLHRGRCFSGARSPRRSLSPAPFSTTNCRPHLGSTQGRLDLHKVLKQTVSPMST